MRHTVYVAAAIAVFGSVSLGGSALAQPRIVDSGGVPPGGVPPGGVPPGGVPLELSEVELSIRLVAHLAETRATLRYRNAAAEERSANLSFPLPVGARLLGYTFEGPGAGDPGLAPEVAAGAESPSLEAVLVDASEELEELYGTSRPGAAAALRGIRLPPVAAGATAAVTVRYISEMAAVTGGYEHRIARRYLSCAADTHLRIEVVGNDLEPSLELTGAGSGGASTVGFNRRGRRTIADDWRPGSSFTGDVVIQVPLPNKRQVVIEQDRFGDTFFALVDPIDSIAEDEGSRQLSGSVAILWDASMSRAEADHRREIGLLVRFLAGLEDGTEVSLTFLRDVASEPLAVELGDSSSVAALEEALRTVVYDGGTRLDRLAAAAGDAALVVLFSDGVPTLDATAAAPMAVPTYVVGWGRSPFLRAIASASGGSHIDLERLDDRTALGLLEERVPRVASVGGIQLANDIYPGVGGVVGDRLVLVGRLAEPSAKLTVRYGYGDRSVRRRGFDLRRSDAIPGETLAGHWAHERIAEALATPARSKEAVDLAGQYGVEVPGMRLAFLTSVEQHIEHRLEPPASRPEWQAAYGEATAAREVDESAYRAGYSKELIESWEERNDWLVDEHLSCAEPPARHVTAETCPSPPAMQSLVPRHGAAPLRASDRAVEWPSRLREAGRGIGGVVTNPEGVVLPGIEVMLIDRERDDLRYRATADPVGSFLFYDLPSGVYEARVERDGSPPTVRPGVRYYGGKAKLFRLVVEAAGVAPPAVAVSAPAPRRSVSAPLLAPYEPGSGYLEALRARPEAAYATYLRERGRHARSPAFHLDCGRFLIDAGEPELGARVLSNVAELAGQSARLLRRMAYELGRAGELERSAEALTRVLELRPDEPQSWRDLALVQIRRAEAAAALELLEHVITTPWEDSAGIELVALDELNALVGETGLTTGLDPRLLRREQADLRVVLRWLEDGSDVDLRVVEPNGEQTFYDHPRSELGGYSTDDVASGYGPEQYLVRSAVAGVYRIEAAYRGNSSLRAAGPAQVQIEVTTDYGRPSELRRVLELRVDDLRGTVTVGEVDFR